MIVCQKCGKIYFDRVNVCDVCNSEEFLINNIINLKDYECQNCKSMYRNKVEICPNCGSKNIDEIGSERKIISNPKLDKCKTKVDTKRFDKIKKMLLVINEFCTVFRAFFAITFIMMGLVLLRFNKSFLLSIIVLVAFFFCLITGLLSIRGVKNKLFFYLRLVYYIAIVFFSFFDRDPAAFYYCAGSLLLYIIITIIQSIFVAKINSINDLELKKVKEKHDYLIKKGILFSNLDYELVPALGKKYYVRVAITSPSGIVMAFQSKQTYSIIDFETVDLLLDVHDLSNFLIFQHDTN